MYCKVKGTTLVKCIGMPIWLGLHSNSRVNRFLLLAAGFEEIQLDDVEQGSSRCKQAGAAISLPTSCEKEALVDKLRLEYPMVDPTMVEIITETVTYDEAKARMLLNTQQRREEHQRRQSTDYGKLNPMMEANLLATSSSSQQDLLSAEDRNVRPSSIVAMPVFIAGAPGQNRRISLQTDTYPGKDDSRFSSEGNGKMPVTMKPSNPGMCKSNQEILV